MPSIAFQHAQLAFRPVQCFAVFEPLNATFEQVKKPKLTPNARKLRRSDARNLAPEPSLPNVLAFGA
jgi:hypothetical protein